MQKHAAAVSEYFLMRRDGGWRVLICPRFFGLVGRDRDIHG
jgi:hypothetical protein